MIVCCFCCSQRRHGAAAAMSRGYYNGGYNNMCEVADRHRYEEIPDIDPSMDFLQADDTTFYYMESPTRLRGGPSGAIADPAERSLLLRGQRRDRRRQRHGVGDGYDDDDDGGGDGHDRSTPCKARRRLDVYGDCTASLPTTPSGGRSADVFAPMMAQTVAAKPVTVRRTRSSAALYNKHKRPPEFLSEYNLDTCVPATGVQYNRPRNTAVIQPIYKAPSSVFQVRYRRGL